MTTDSMTPADLGAIMGNGGMEGGAWWIIILFLFAFMGWGGNGFGNNSSGAMDNYVLASDFATLQRQVDSSTSSLERKGDTINAGLCDGFYAMNTGLLNGFAGVNSAIAQNGYDTRNAIQSAQIAEMQNANSIQSAISGINYNMATNTNAIQNSVSSGFCQSNYNASTNTRDIIDSQNANTQAILSAIQNMESNAKDAKIAEQQAQISALQLSASQQAQNAYLVSELAPKNPIPAFNVPNPYASYYGGCGCS